jgi:CheY-like chemotaxis protein
MQKTILIVDFEQESGESIRAALQSEGFRLLMASDGCEALSLFESQTPDLVLTTALLPKLNGFELCKKITSGELGQTRPVIMYSDIYRAEKYRKEAMAGCGALEFLDQPVPKWQLMRAVKSSFSEIPIGIGSRTGLDSSGLPLEDSAHPSLAKSSQIHVATEDPLGVARLFETAKPAPTASTPLPELEPQVPDHPATRPSSSSGIDDSEIDAAVDACRLDLDEESHQRDEHLARQFEQQLIDEGGSILEFESSPGGRTAGAANPGGEQEPQVFELDEIKLVAAQVAGNRAHETSSAAQAAEPPSGVFSPVSSDKTRVSSNWQRLAVLGAFLLLAGLIFLLVSR